VALTIAPLYRLISHGTCARRGAAARLVPRPASGVDPNAVLTLVAVAQFMVVLDATVVNVALPTIKGDLGFSEQNLSWVLNAHTLIFGGLLLLGGRLADGSGGGCSS
jgi:hypothetical protein